MRQWCATRITIIFIIAHVGHVRSPCVIYVDKSLLYVGHIRSPFMIYVGRSLFCMICVLCGRDHLAGCEPYDLHHLARVFSGLGPELRRSGTCDRIHNINR